MIRPIGRSASFDVQSGFGLRHRGGLGDGRDPDRVRAHPNLVATEDAVHDGEGVMQRCYKKARGL